jgi:hypothetical protein
MANTLTITALAENIFRARDIVAKEPTGFIQSVMLNTSRDGASINGTVTSFVTAQPTLNTSYTPSMTIPSGDDQTITALTMQLDQVANVRIPLVGETLKQLESTVGGQRALDDMFANAIRKLRNTIESHVGSVVQLGASRATGTSGTTPFASTINDIPNVRKILVDNGVPLDGQISLVLNTTAGTALRSIPNLYKANEAGSTDLLRRGELSNIMGLSIKESAGVKLTTAGTGASYLVNSAALVAGSTTIPADTGSGTILAGDVVTISSNKYVVATALSAGSFTIAAPGLVAAVADNTAITVNAAYSANSAFHKNAIELAIRPPSQPYGGDAAVDRITVSDDTGLVFEVAQYKGYGMAMFDFTAFYKAKVWKPDFVATLLG